MVVLAQLGLPGVMELLVILLIFLLVTVVFVGIPLVLIAATVWIGANDLSLVGDDDEGGGTDGGESGGDGTDDEDAARERDAAPADEPTAGADAGADAED